MRVKRPEPFDPNREYRPGERCVYRGMVLIAEIWTAADARLANNNSTMFAQRCVRCKIKREDCPGIGRQCDKFHRSDRKTIYWRLLRIVGGFKGVETLEFNYNGTNAGQRINGKEGDAMKNKCSSEIPNMPTECAPDNRRPEKICGTCRYFNPEFPVNGKPAPVCLAIKEMKGGTEYTNPRGTQHYFRCSNGRYENGIGQ